VICDLEFGIWNLGFGIFFIWWFILPRLEKIRQRTGIGHRSLVIGHWSLVKRMRKEAEKGRKGERRRETGRE